jgi:hypothetical protein
MIFILLALTKKQWSFANSLISSTEFTASVEPGITGTPAE